jgi:uncharacterized protein
MTGTTGLGVFAKYPVPGQVKTRLARSVGKDEAARIYECLLGHLIEHTLLEAGRSGLEITFYCDPFMPESEYQRLLGFTGFGIALQEGPDLGARMKRAAQQLLERHGRALIIGTDCIDVTPPLLTLAANSLLKDDLSLGPTGDGGYYLIGMKQAADALFDDIPWSTPRVLPLTLQRAEDLGWKTHLLQPMRDVDNQADWEAIGWRCDENNEAIRSLRRKKT